jgi:hypothetical protein
MEARRNVSTELKRGTKELRSSISTDVSALDLILDQPLLSLARSSPFHQLLDPPQQHLQRSREDTRRGIQDGFMAGGRNVRGGGRERETFTFGGESFA